MTNQTGRQTTTTTTTTTQEEVRPILKLRPAEDQSAEKPTKKKNGVKWEEGVVDNENMNKKKSKICCIFHPHREFGELSSDESSDLSSDLSSDESGDADHDCCNHGKKRKARKSSPNAYEKQPKYTNKSTLPDQRTK